MNSTDLTFVEVRTSGNRPKRDRIVEIALMRISATEASKQFHSLIRPTSSLSADIVFSVPTLRQKSNLPTFKDVSDTIRELIKDSVVVSANARLVYGFLTQEFKESGTSFQFKHVSLEKLGLAKMPQALSQSLLPSLESNLLQRVQALATTYRQKMLEDNEKALTRQVQDAAKHPSLPNRITLDAIEQLPKASGVYFFYGENNTLLYIGKSVNIRERVMSHFAQNHLDGKEMKIAALIHRIETVVTPGELSALLLESTLVKQHKPLYNRKLQEAMAVQTLYQTHLPNGYYSTRTEAVRKVTSYEQLLGVFSSKMQVQTFLRKLSSDEGLCSKLLGLEKTLSSCFDYRLGKCKGACTGKESPEQYNARFLDAVKRYRVKSWPFAGPILVEEKALSNAPRKKQYLIIDKWCYLGSTDLLSGRDITPAKEYVFDKDTYSILAAYLTTPKYLKMIKIHQLAEQYQLI